VRGGNWILSYLPHMKTGIKGIFDESRLVRMTYVSYPPHTHARRHCPTDPQAMQQKHLEMCSELIVSFISPATNSVVQRKISLNVSYIYVPKISPVVQVF
jgi:hypothetical protein